MYDDDWRRKPQTPNPKPDDDYGGDDDDELHPAERIVLDDDGDDVKNPD
jgi:hypothetical protein